MLEKRLIQWMLKPTSKWIFLSVIVSLTIFFGWQLPRLEFNFELEQLFPKSDPDLQFFDAHVKKFGYDNDFVSILLISEDGIFSDSYLKEIRRTSARLLAIEGVNSVWNPLQLKRLSSTPYGLVNSNLFQAPANYPSDSLFVTQDPWLSEYFSYESFLPISIEHTHLTDQVSVKKLNKQLMEVLEKQPFKFHILGKISAQEEFNYYIKRDFGQFIALSITVCILVLLAIFRNFRATIFPLLVCSITLIWVFGMMALVITPVSIVTSLIPPLMLFISSSDAVHLLSALKRKGTKKDAYQKVLFPTFLTSITTGIGFLSIWMIPVAPVSELGLFCGVGAVFAFFVTYGLAPFLKDQKVEKHRKLDLSILFESSIRFRKPIAYLFIVIGAVGIFGSFQLESNAYLLKDLPPTSKARQAFDYGDQHLGGTKPWAMEVWVKESTLGIWDPPVQQEIHKITQYLEEKMPVSAIRSSSSVLTYTTFLQSGEMKIPERKTRSYSDAQQILNRQNFNLVSQDAKSARITALIPELGSKATLDLNNALLEHLNETIDPQILGYQLTGTNTLIDKSNALLAGYMLKSLLIAIGLVSLLLGLYFRSLKMLLISLLPNLLPLLMVGGLVYFMEIPIQFSTSIIFALTFGIVVDDTIHFLTTYRRTEGTINERIISTLNTAGSGILNTTLILISGFIIMMFSSFGATFYLGLFLSCSLALALITDLILLPIILKYLNPDPVT